jgi:hypothetical protein
VALTQEQGLEQRLMEAACSAPGELLIRTWRGHRADRSGDLELLTAEPDFVGHGGLPHSGPWDYVGMVPLFWYGPGFIRAQGEVGRPVTLADVAPTQGELVGLPFDAPDGAPLVEALEPGAGRPKLDAIEAQDAELPALVDLLNEHVGEGNWVMALTADHGHTPDPAVSGASVISPPAVAEAIQSRFDTDDDDARIVEFTQPTHVFVDLDEMEQNGATLDEIASYLLTVTKGEVDGGQYPVSPDAADEPAFLAVYPSSMLEDLPCLQGKIPDHGSKGLVAPDQG